MITERASPRPKQIDLGVYEYGEWFIRWDAGREVWLCESQVEPGLQILVYGALGSAIRIIDDEVEARRTRREVRS